MIKNNFIQNSINGTAVGDAWGKEMEFLTFDEIKHIKHPFPKKAYITDDTQMSLYAMEAILDNKETVFKNFIDNPNQLNANECRKTFMDYFIAFGADPKNNRAPGVACMTAIIKATHNHNTMVTGLEFTNWDSKGCGANMRNSWFGLLPYSKERIAYLSVLQAETTHSHPLALSSAIVTALIVKKIVEEGNIFSNRNGIENIAYICETARGYSYGNSSELVHQGLHELENFVNTKQHEYKNFLNSVEESNICFFLGEGWVAEEALLCAVGATEKYGFLDPQTGLQGIERLIRSSGDSDSIAAIGGAMIGASLPTTENVYESYINSMETEYQNRLNDVIKNLS